MEFRPEGPPTEAGLEIGRYTLIYRFATGGMAHLYLSRISGPAGFEKLVAIKLIHEHLASNHAFINMFLDEARLAARIRHPNVVQILELGRESGRFFIAMEFVEGESLASLIKRYAIPFSMCAWIIAGAAAGLHAAHQVRDADGALLHLVHRDVSPQNILISYYGVVKVVDFGVARAQGSLHTTDTGAVIGKHGYMAPEQACAAEVDHRADIFSLGVVLYELTTRQRLFKSSQLIELMGRIPPPSTVIDGYPAELEQIVLRALSWDPDQRYQSAEELQEALEAFTFASQEQVTSSSVGRLMSELFAGNIVEKAEHLRAHVRQLDDVAREAATRYELSGGARRGRGGARPGRAGRRLLGIAAIISALAGVITLLLVLLPRPEPAPGVDSQRPLTAAPPVAVSPPRDAPPPAAPPAMVSFSITALPPHASIRFDDERVGNPCVLSRPPAKGEVRAVISAPGFVTQELSVPLAEGGRWVVSLSQKAAPRRTRRSFPGRGKRAKTSGVDRTKQAGKLGDDQVLSNPYQK